MEKSNTSFRERSTKKLLFVLTLLMILIWTPIIYAKSLDCLPTGELAGELMRSDFAYVSTFTSSDDIVFQLYVAQDGRWKISWVRGYGDKSCLLFSGYEWNWAMPKT